MHCLVLVFERCAEFVRWRKIIVVIVPGKGRKKALTWQFHEWEKGIRMAEFSEIQGIINWAIDMLKNFYLVRGVSIWLMFQITIWVGVAVSLVRYSMDKWG